MSTCSCRTRHQEVRLQIEVTQHSKNSYSGNDNQRDLFGCVRKGFAFLFVSEIIPKKSAMDTKGKPANIYLFNCDSTCNLDSIESLLLTVQNGVKMRFTVHKRNFRLREMSAMSETVIPGLKMDFAVFVVHAHESRLSINEDNAGIGYASLYRALKRASGESKR